LVERTTPKPDIRGSNPIIGNNYNEYVYQSYYL